MGRRNGGVEKVKGFGSKSMRKERREGREKSRKRNEYKKKRSKNGRKRD